MRTGGWVLMLALVVGCESSPGDPADLSALDGAASDAAEPDAGADARPDGSPDAGPVDGAPPDATPIDATADSTPDAVVDEPPARGPDPHPALRMNHLQVRGTHNSYHIANVPTLPEWDYTHLPLSEQLSDQGVRQFELDVHWNPDLEGFEVYHLPGVDDLSVCRLYVDCLREIDTWLRRNPDEGPVYVLLEPKDDVDPLPVRDHLDALDAVVRDTIAPWRLITPDDVRRGHADVASGLRAEGWPSLHWARGRVMFILLDEGETYDAYVAGDPVLEGRIYFPPSAEDPWSAVLLMDDAPPDAVRARVEEGFLVRTRADMTDVFERTLGGGSHMVSTDFPDELVFEDGRPTRCNPINAPPSCADR